MNIGVDTNSGCWVRLSNGFAVKLDADPSLGDESVDTDEDGIPDLIELGKEHTIFTYNPATKKVESYRTWTFTSNPVKADTDGDGLSDLYDKNPCRYDITAEVNDGATIEFNTGKTWYYANCTVYDYLDNFFARTTTDNQVDNWIPSEEFDKITKRLGKNALYIP